MTDKQQIRTINKQKRSSMSSKEACAGSRLAAMRFLNSDMYCRSRVLMLYMPLGNETDTSLITERALADGKKIVFPVTDTENTDIIPCYADSSTMFSRGAFSILEPEKSMKADASDIDTVLVPGIAFSESGARVGFGKGFYDRFLARINAVRVGFCYDFQICNEIVADPHDVQMDFIVCESKIFDCKSKK